MAQHWDIEKVDSAGWGAAVDMRWHPDGRLFLCYSATSGIIRLASKDSIWSYEDLPQWYPTLSGSQGFDIDRRGRIGVSYASTDNHHRYALKTDTGWTDVPTPFNEIPPHYPYLTTLDTAGAPTITVQTGDVFELACLRDTTWVPRTLMSGVSDYENDFHCCDLGPTAEGVVWGVFTHFMYFPLCYMSGMDLYSFQVRDSEVAVVLVRDNPWGIGAASGCVDRQGSVHSCYCYWPTELCLDHTAIDTPIVNLTAVKFDSRDRPQIAYVPSAGGLLYRYLEVGVWHIFDLQVTGVTALSLIIDKQSQPFVAYTTSQGVFLAHGVDVVGQSEEQREPSVLGSWPRAALVRNVLDLPVSPRPVRAALFDMTGRRVADLRSGANDVSGLAPGMYFVREETQASSHKLQAVQKVVITR